MAIVKHSDLSPAEKREAALASNKPVTFIEFHDEDLKHYSTQPDLIAKLDSDEDGLSLTLVANVSVFDAINDWDVRRKVEVRVLSLSNRGVVVLRSETMRVLNMHTSSLPKAKNHISPRCVLRLNLLPDCE